MNTTRDEIMKEEEDGGGGAVIITVAWCRKGTYGTWIFGGCATLLSLTAKALLQAESALPAALRTARRSKHQYQQPS